MDKNVYVLIAAIVAALASMLSVAFTIYFNWVSKSKEKHAELVGGYLVKVSRTLHEVVAVPRIVVNRARNGESINTWVDRDKESVDVLKEIAKETRFIFGELVCGFKELTRLRGYVQHYIQRDIARSEALVDAADDLRSALDSAIVDSYKRGGFPASKHVENVKSLANKLKELSGFGNHCSTLHADSD